MSLYLWALKGIGPTNESVRAVLETGEPATQTEASFLNWQVSIRDSQQILRLSLAFVSVV